eukprot:CAMPEP_0183419342 /NCGR_PEP_ID=MMETSP0370-20130417/25717_1 /TAXON_ID=268820 /ORGANISM="Peridinium aciculiferum, Strain PAER-2" /LENGTH=344 /DNA_ID=CAMNT_0025603131 /DNA_START=15 /DNA_END=1049 /DNA_ORIENTATION=-
MSSPVLLWVIYETKKKLVIQALLVGDYTYYRQYDVPHDLVRQSRGSESFSLLVPGVVGSQAGTRALPDSTIIVGGDVFFMLLRHMEWWVRMAPTAVASTIIFPRYMALLCELAVEENFRSWHRAAFVKAGMLMPALVAVGFSCLFSYQNLDVFKKVSIYERFLWLLHLLLFNSLNCLLVLPPLQVLWHGAAISLAEMHVFVELWTAGGLIFSRDVSEMLETIVGPGEIRAVLHIKACLLRKPVFVCGSSDLASWGSVMEHPTFLEAWAVSRQELVEMYGLGGLVDLARKFIADHEAADEAETGEACDVRRHSERIKWSQALRSLEIGSPAPDGSEIPLIGMEGI